jgi:hypothetical protein
VIEPAVLAGRDRYERVMDGWTDNTHTEGFAHTVRLSEPDRTVELCVVALPSPEYAIREARARAVSGDVEPRVVDAVGTLAGTRMVAGFTRAMADAVGRGAGASLLVDAGIEAARLARQVTNLPRDRAERAAGGDPWECWQLDTTGWSDLPDSCFTYSDAGRALFGTRTIVSPMQPDLYSPRPGQTRVFVRRKVARIERAGAVLTLSHSMHDNVHGFDLTLAIEARTGHIERAESVTSRLPYAGICSEPQGKIKTLIGERVDGGLRKRLASHVGGVTGCAQLFDLTADLLKLLA